jgi:hypothetical protein
MQAGANVAEIALHMTAFAGCGLAVTNKSSAKAAKIAFIATSQFLKETILEYIFKKCNQSMPRLPHGKPVAEVMQSVDGAAENR